MFDTRITSILLAKGTELFRSPRTLVQFTKDADADQLLNDIEGFPHAFVLACVMDRQVKAELAWLIPHRLSLKLGGFDFANLQRLSLDQTIELMTQPEPLHRFPSMMAANLHAAVRRIAKEYDGNAALIWADLPSSALIVFRFLCFDGVGSKIATMATNILARDIKIPMSDYYSIDISVDVHVRRVFGRLGFVPPDASDQELTYAARAISPSFPGLLDYPCWQVGREWCRPQEPNCSQCYMEAVCPSARSGEGHVGRPTTR